jgi:NADH dehydrogenase
VLPHVVIIGGGFGGLSAARALRNADVRVTLIDRRNHHLFQPLLYQVATATLSPGDIAAPIRWILRRIRNVRVLLADATRIDVTARRVELADGGALDYDWLIVATGSRHAYFGHSDWEPNAPGLKTLEDAIAIRRRILIAFERAEREENDMRQGELLTFVIVGGGPTGVELVVRSPKSRDRRYATSSSPSTPRVHASCSSKPAPPFFRPFPRNFAMPRAARCSVLVSRFVRTLRSRLSMRKA